MTDDRFAQWVERYVSAWNSNEPSEIRDLFVPEGRYLTEPYATPWVGRDEIVSEWLKAKDEPGDTTFDYRVIVSTDDLGIVKGETFYRSTEKRYSNLWEIQLDDEGRCMEFVEWWMEHRSQA